MRCRSTTVTEKSDYQLIYYKPSVTTLALIRMNVSISPAMNLYIPIGPVVVVRWLLQHIASNRIDGSSLCLVLRFNSTTISHKPFARIPITKSFALEADIKSYSQSKPLVVNINGTEEIGHFADCLREGKRPIHSVEEGRAVLELILKASETADGWQNNSFVKPA